MKALEAQEVAAWVREVLLAPHRERPVVAVTTRPRTGSTWIEPGELARALGDAADVVCLETGDATWELTEALPPRLDVYGGAIRVWWPGLREDSNPFDHKLYFVHSSAQAQVVLDALVEAIRETGDAPGEAPEVRTLTVTSVDGTRVELGDDEHRGELREADVPLPELARCLRPGVPLSVRPIRQLPDERWELSARGLLPSPWEIAAGSVVVGDVVLGRVQSTRDFGAFIEVLPRVTGLVHVSEIDWTFVDSVSEFLVPGQLVPVKVLATSWEERKIELSVKRAIGSTPRELPSLVPDGEPFSWPAEEAPGEEPPETVRERLAELTDELDAAASDRVKLTETNKSLREQNLELKKQLRRTQDRIADLERQLAPELDPLSSERGFLLGVRLAYARLFDEGSRAEHPLCRMRVGPRFLESVRTIEGIETDKVLEVCAQVAANAAHELASREVHQLREGVRGAGTRVRASDGAQAWRCALQVKSPSARRLHWWRIPGDDGGTIEFANVVLHDDFSIPE